MANLPVEFKNQWVAALRSGKYKQGKQRLYNQAADTYCCLGVAAHMCESLPSTLYNSALIPSVSFQSGTGQVLKVPVELSDDEPLQKRLWEMNDDQEKSFEEIADYIEANL